jgi:hypothetical protein
MVKPEGRGIQVPAFRFFNLAIECFHGFIVLFVG